MAVVRQIRSWMFGPGNREKFITKAKTSPADCVLLDLEDGMLPSEKADARKMVTATLAEAWEGGPQRYVRLNALNTPWFKDDMDQVVRAGLDGVCMTKVTRPQDIHEATAQFDTLERHQGRGDASVAVGWQLVDKPILLRALRILESIGEYPGTSFLLFWLSMFCACPGRIDRLWRVFMGPHEWRILS